MPWAVPGRKNFTFKNITVSEIVCTSAVMKQEYICMRLKVKGRRHRRRARL